jgi:hypothetical protein
MLVRVVAAHVAADDVGGVNSEMRAFLTDIRAQPGLAYAKLARRLLPDDSEEILLVEEWLTPADLFAWTRGELDSPRLPKVSHGLLRNVTITHYESLDRMPEELDLEVIEGGLATAGGLVGADG